MSKKTNTLRIAVHFNPESKQWIARHSKRTPHQANEGMFRDNQYGYGNSLMEAVDEVISLSGSMATKLMCKVITPSKHIHTVHLS